jgi:hypothetical protein
MASSEVDIANAALIMVGESTIASLTDETKSARVCNHRYASVRDAILRRHPWNCATKRVDLGAVLAGTDVPAFGYTYAYQLPADFLRVVQLQELDEPYKVEGRKFLTNVNPAKIIYIYKITDVSAMDSLLTEAISAQLASEIAKSIGGSETMARAMAEMANEKIQEAQYADSRESGIDQITSSTWLDARHGQDSNYRAISEV